MQVYPVTQESVTASQFEAAWDGWFDQQTEAIENPESAPGPI